MFRNYLKIALRSLWRSRSHALMFGLMLVSQMTTTCTENFILNVIDEDYISTLDIQFVNGRNYEKGNLSDRRRGVIINEAFAKMFDWKDPLSSKIPGMKFGDHEIIGVVKDFNYTSLYTTIPPLVMVQDPSIILPGIENVNIDNSPIPKLFVKIRSGKIPGTMMQVKTAWEKVSSGEEFNYSFLDESFKIAI